MNCFSTDEEEDEEDLSGLHPGALLYRSAALQNFPVMADALAHGADVNWVNTNEESSTPLIQAVTAVREGGRERCLIPSGDQSMISQSIINQLTFICKVVFPQFSAAQTAFQTTHELRRQDQVKCNKIDLESYNITSRGYSPPCLNPTLGVCHSPNKCMCKI